MVSHSGAWMSGTADGAALTKAAFAHFPVIRPAIVVVGLLTFVFSTTLGWPAPLGRHEPRRNRGLILRATMFYMLCAQIQLTFSRGQ